MNSKLRPEDEAALDAISEIAQRETGVQLSERHRPMISSRLQRRIGELKLKGLADYLRHLERNFAQERKFLVALITTHHTYFFREFAHFEYLRDAGLPEVVRALRAEGRRELRIWSAACSRGQEAYSLAMWILPWLKANAPDISLKIFGSDIDAESVTIASNGVYPKSDLDGAPLALLGDHWARGTGEIAAYVKAKASLRNCVSFATESLFSLPVNGEKYDVIFCRNVFIYFNPEQIRAIGNELVKRLAPHGLLFVGISETLSGLDLPYVPAAPSAYRLKGAPSLAAPAVAGAVAKAPPPAAPARPEPIRVLCVDDSPTILAIMKKILVEAHGFKIVGTALDGIEAAAKVHAGGIDLVTLDIHMPRMDGIQYLTEHYRAGHPPVVMVSSVSRENAGLALKALELGASDYVEKPSLADLNERADEIRMKLKTARLGAKAPAAKLDRAFADRLHLSDPENCARLVVVAAGAGQRAADALRALTSADPATLVILENPGERVNFPAALREAASPAAVGAGAFFVARDAFSQAAVEKALAGKRSVSVLVFGALSAAEEARCARLGQPQVLVEDLGPQTRLPARGDVWRLPATSFLYQSFEFFAKGRRAA